MYARFLISLAMLSIALTISAIHIYSSTQKYYKPFVKEQESISSKTGFQFYAIPPILTIATIKALYLYENYVWTSVKASNLVSTGVDGDKIIKWLAEVKESGGGCHGGMPMAGPTITAYMGGSGCAVGSGPIVLVCADKDAAGNCICKKETFDYVKTYLNFFTNVTKKEYLEKFVGYLETFGNTMLKTLNKYNKVNFGDKSLQYVVDDVEIVPLANITKPVIPNKTAILLVIYIVDVKKDGKLVYKLKVPFEIDIRVEVLGDLKNTIDQKFALQHIISYAYVNKVKDVKGHCVLSPKTEPEGFPTPTTEEESCSYCTPCDGCPPHSSGCHVTCHTETFWITVNKWDIEHVPAPYGKKEKTSVTFSKAGYTGLHYVYRIVNRIVYREDLTNIPFRSYNISKIYNMILTPFVRTSGYAYNENWVINDTWVYKHSSPTGDACFAQHEKPGMGGSYDVPGNFKGLPHGGFCNGYTFYVSGTGVDSYSGDTMSVEGGGLSICGSIDTDHPHGCVCYIDEIPDIGYPPHAWLFARRCLKPVTDTINHELIIHTLMIDKYCWNQTKEGDEPFNCHAS